MHFAHDSVMFLKMRHGFCETDPSKNGMKNFRIVSGTVQFVRAERCEVRPDKVCFFLSKMVVKSYLPSDVRLVEELDTALNPKEVIYTKNIAHGIEP
jgi:hypothetical protein